jgi:hypothetical protein
MLGCDVISSEADEATPGLSWVLFTRSQGDDLR